MSMYVWAWFTGLSGATEEKQNMKLTGVILEGYVENRRKMGLHVIIFYFMHL